MHDFDKSPGLSAVEFISGTLVILTRSTETKHGEMSQARV